MSSGWATTVSSRTVHEGHVVLRVDDVRFGDGPTVGREVVVVPNVVTVVPIVDGDVVLLRQHRHAVGGDVLELPAGGIDDGEDALAAGHRELAEECGLGGGSWRQLTSVWTSPGWTTERRTVLLAEGVEVVPRPAPPVDAPEEAAAEVVRLPFAVAVAAARDGTLVDAATTLALLCAEAVVGT